jgi:ABC-type branched-subunit amino acid transport system substrate-binding protein
LTVALSVALVVAGWVGTSQGANAASLVAKTSSCTGSPLKVMTITSLTGPLAVFGNPYTPAAEAAERAINSNCSLGRPLQVTVCDDQSTPNGSLECGDKARSNGTLALIGSTTGAGGSDEGAETAGLPAVFTAAETSWDSGNKLSYPYNSNFLGTAAEVQLAKTLGRKSFMVAAVDVPDAHATVQILVKVAASLGITLKQVYFPLDTTDFGPVAAQILAAKPGLLTYFVPESAPFLTALSSAGLASSAVKTVVPQGLLTNQQEQEVAKIIEGSYEVGGVIPTTAASNAGIKEMKQEYRAAGETFSTSLSTGAVAEWQVVHALADALQPLGKAKLKSLTSKQLLQAVINHGTYNLPTLAPFNYQRLAYSKSSPLGGARIFSRGYQVFQYKKGVGQPVGGFRSLNLPK